MTEYDRDAQRQSVGPDDRSAQPDGTAPRDQEPRASSGPEPSAFPSAQHLPPSAQHSTPGAQPASPWVSSAPQYGAAHSAAPHPGAPTSGPSPWAGPAGATGETPTLASRGGYGSTGHPGGVGPGGYGGPHPGHPGHQGQPGHPGHPGHPGQPGPYQQAGMAPPFGPGQPWGQPGPEHRGDRRGPGRFLAIGAAALVLAVGSGLLGGVVATQLDDGSPIGVGSNRTSAAAPILQRDSLAEVADAVKPSVVSISTGASEGSGVVMTSDGFIVTNNHVVASAQGAQVDVVSAGGRTAKGRVIGTDARTDLAVVKVDNVDGLRPAKFGDSSAMQVGDTVLALGSPLGLQGSVTAGIVSSLDRTIRVGGQEQSPLLPQQQPQEGVQSMAGLLQTDAPINPGNSGGALVNLAGEVIGINTAIATSGQGQGNIGVGFAIPSNKAKQVAEQLRGGGKVQHPYLGVSVIDAEGGNGALVGTVQPNSPAAQVGLQKGDVVLKLGDKEINGSDDLVSAVQNGKVGDKLTVTYVRNGEQRTATVTLGEAS